MESKISSRWHFTTTPSSLPQASSSVAMTSKGAVAPARSTIIIMLKKPETMVCVMSRMLMLCSAM